MKITLILLTLAFITPNMRAADLDAPGGKTVTIGTEIKRGGKAVWDIASADPYEFATRYGDLLKDNEQSRKDTDGFILGAQHQAWMSEWMTLKILAQDPRNSERLKAAMEMTQSFFTRFRAKQTELGLTDEQMAQALTMDTARFKATVDAWQNRK